MRELYLDPSLYEFVDTLDIESYERFCAVTDACATALQRMTKKPDACTVRAFGVTVRVERSKDRKYYVICAIDIVDLDPPPEGWGKNKASVLETYFELPPCISDQRLPPHRDDVVNFRGRVPVACALLSSHLGLLTAALALHDNNKGAREAMLDHAQMAQSPSGSPAPALLDLLTRSGPDEL